MQNNFEIVYLKLDEISVNPTNPKIHTAEQIEQIKSSIREFGFNDPLAVDENNILIEGHGRLIAASELGMETVPVFIIPGLTEEEKTAYALVHNQLTLNTGFSYELLKEELKNIEAFDMTQYSFDIVLDDYFDDQLIEEYDSKVYIRTENPNDADIIRDFLVNNDYKFKEK